MKKQESPGFSRGEQVNKHLTITHEPANKKTGPMPTAVLAIHDEHGEVVEQATLTGCCFDWRSHTTVETGPDGEDRIASIERELVIAYSGVERIFPTPPRQAKETS